MIELLTLKEVGPMLSKIDIYPVAVAAHQANYAYCLAIGDKTEPWSKCSTKIKESVLEGVRRVLEGETAEQLHSSWLKFKIRDGWIFGVEKDEAKKTHPCLVPYDDLPANQKYKDTLFQTTVSEMLSSIVMHKALS
jgi:hypothetical protein